jgi:hypothetical protein
MPQDRRDTLKFLAPGDLCGKGFRAYAEKFNTSCLADIKAQLQLSRIRHAAGVPRGIEDNLHVYLLHFRQARELVFDVSLKDITHAAAGSGHGHFYIDFFPAFVRSYVAGVDQAQIYDVDGDLGVVNGLELVPN